MQHQNNSKMQCSGSSVIEKLYGLLEMIEMNENLGWITTMFCLFSQYHCFYLSKMVETFT